MKYDYLVLIMMGFCVQAMADNTPLCRSMEGFMPTRPNLPKFQDDNYRLSANHADIQEINGTKHYLFSDDVLLQYQQRTARADQATYREDTALLTAEGNVTLWDNQLIVQAKKANIRADHTGEAFDMQYWLPKRRGHGEALSAERLNSEQIRLQDTRYTTCDPNEETWRLQGKEIDLNFKEDQGVARDVSLRIKNVPVLYLPYLSFPLSDKRKSGFLMPSGGYSKNRGIEINTPYYFNLAPNYDATLTPRLMTKRGLMLESEFRYLTETSRGKIISEYLSNDREEINHSNRYFWQLKNTTKFNPQWTGEIYYNKTSDAHYFEHFGTTPEVNNITHLEQRGDLKFQNNLWRFTGRAQRYQTLLENLNTKPYERLPQLLAETVQTKRNNQLYFQTNAEYVHFNRDDKEAINGQRSNFTSAISYPFKKLAGFFEPKLRLDYTNYQLENAPTENRFLYSTSIDGGLFFERSMDFNNTPLLQTLEPRLFYLYRPYKDQKNLPIYDTAETDFSFNQLFRDNRFSGTDRLSDENRIATSLTTRFLDQGNGEEYLRASVGQIYYFEKPQVTLPTQTHFIKDNISDLLEEVSLRLSKDFTVSQSVQWNPQQRETIKSTARLSYQPSGQNSVINVAHRMRKDLAEKMNQTDISWFLPVTNYWRVLGRWNYSLENHKHLETFAGFEYESCCWALRLVGRRYLQNAQNDYSNGIYLQFEFKGLGGTGKTTNTFLQQSISGFHSPLEEGIRK
ncbi:MAG: assembly protein LptD [Pseudomonadota bacterium]|jgi:LPS-assembly protein